MTKDEKYYLDIFKERWKENYFSIPLILFDKEILDIINDSMTITKALDRVFDKILAIDNADVQE